MNNPRTASAWRWIPSLYFAEGVPYTVVMMVSVIFYKRMGISNMEIALYTSWLYLPWVIKPLWSPVVDLLRTKRFWIVAMQLLIGAGLAGVALTTPLPGFFRFTLLFFWLLAFSSATHDIAADGFYMLGLNQHDQTWFVGIRSTFYRLAMITGQGLLIILAGYVEGHSGLPVQQITVQAVAADEHRGAVFPEADSLVWAADGEIRLLCSSDQLLISTAPLPKDSAAALAAKISEFNTANGHAFHPPLRSVQTGNSDAESGWWRGYVSGPLENFLSASFGRDKKTSRIAGATGNTGIVYFRLSQAPQNDKIIEVNFGRTSGDKSIGLFENHQLNSSHFSFDSSNWDKPVAVMFQLDPKLDFETRAIFTAHSGNIPLAWLITFAVLALLFILFFIYHVISLPRPAADTPNLSGSSFMKNFYETFASFFRKERMWAIMLFLLLYRLAESQLVKLAAPFLLDTQENGGLALTTGQVGLVYGTVGLVMLTLGGLSGGFVAARQGLKYWLLPMALAINLPDLVYVYLSAVQPDSFLLINICVAIEQFGYGFGFTAYLLYSIHISEGKHKTAHYAIATGFMALGMMLPGMMSGWLQEIIGYKNFFIWVMISTLPSFLVLFFIKISPDFGRKTAASAGDSGN